MPDIHKETLTASAMIRESTEDLTTSRGEYQLHLLINWSKLHVLARRRPSPPDPKSRPISLSTPRPFCPISTCPLPPLPPTSLTHTVIASNHTFCVYLFLLMHIIDARSRYPRNPCIVKKGTQRHYVTTPVERVPMKVATTIHR